MRRLQLSSGILALALAACGGGDGNGNGSPSPPPNVAPIITSGTSVSVVENSMGPVYVATATDPENAPLVLAISGLDAARFTIGPNGAIQFTSPPNFDAPADLDKNNSYLFELSASDGTNTSKQIVEIKVTNSTEGVAIRRVATGLTDPLLLSIETVPGDPSKLFLVQRKAIYLFDPATGARTLVWEVPPPPVVAASIGDEFIYDFKAAPDYQTSHAFYAWIEQTDHSGVRYYKPRPDGSFVYRGRSVGPTGKIVIGPDNNIYIFRGCNDCELSTSSPNTTNAAILRYAQTPSGGFAPAPGNPYLASGGQPEIFDYGVSSAVGISFYNEYLIFLSGGAELNMASITNGGLSFGWPYFEGVTRVREGGPASVVDPAMLLTGDMFVPFTPRGGFVYKGSIASLSGKYVYLTKSGNVRTIDLSLLVPGQLVPTQAEARDSDFVPDVGTLDGLRLVRQDEAGNVWLLTEAGDLFLLRAG